VVTDTSEEIFASVNVTNNILRWLTIATVVVLVVFTFIMVNVAMKPLAVVEKSLLKLSKFDITEDKSFEKYTKRKDEIGGIATALKTLLDSYRSIIPTIKNASNTLKSIVSDLYMSTGITSETCSQISQAIENVASGAVSQAEDTTKASSNIMCMSDELTKINGNTEDLQSISVSMDSAKQDAVNTLAELQKVNNIMIEDVNNTSNQVKVTSESMNDIKNAIKMIDNIASQTHLLSLNASIEASKAGESGRGFSVVATEMGKLANQSAEYSSEIKKIIADVEKNYEMIIETVNLTNNNMMVQSEKLTDTQNVFAVLDGNISDTVERIGSINTMVESLSKELTEIVDMLSNLSAISQENSASTEETMAGIEELNTIIMQVNEKATVVNDSADTLIEEVGVFKTE
jgi:methyl-accepting chemotaxis protein